MDLELRNFAKEIIVSASKSSGPGGQNVNKVNTKIEIRFNINSSNILTSVEKEIILEKLKNKISLDGYLVIVSQKERSQLKNKINAINKLNLLIFNALKIKKKRIPTKIPKSIIEKRIKDKKNTSEKKLLRTNKKIDF
jgi:ribosome-associated protein